MSMSNATLYLVWPEAEDDTKSVVAAAFAGNEGLDQLKSRFPDMRLALSADEIQGSLKMWMRKPVFTDVPTGQRFLLVAEKADGNSSMIVVRSTDRHAAMRRASQQLPGYRFASVGTLEQWLDGWDEMVSLSGGQLAKVSSWKGGFRSKPRRISRSTACAV